LLINVFYPQGILCKKITSCMWFDHQAEEAANFHTSIFRNSKIGSVTRGTRAEEIAGIAR
jgi:predicted 3-demethylubiquinone-9 3-methyltransferase (glyoxalase superfamily)